MRAGQTISSSNKCGAFFCRGGMVEISTGIDSYSLTRDTVYIYTGATSVTIKSISADACGYLAEFDISRLVGAINKVMDAPNILFLLENPMLCLKPETADHIDALAEQLVADVGNLREKGLSHTSRVIRQELIHSKSEVLTYTMLDAYFADNNMLLVATDRRSDIFQQFMLSLYRDFRHVRDVETYASRQCLSPRYFSSIIKEKSGMLPSDIIADLVIAEARQMLADPRLSIKQIATALNFPSQSFFGKYFKRRTGISPRQYRDGINARGQEPERQ